MRHDGPLAPARGRHVEEVEQSVTENQPAQPRTFSRTVAEHRDHVLDAVRPLAPRRLPLAEAQGCVLAEDVTATLAVPPFTNSAMDGYAVLAADVAAASPEAPVTLRVIGDQPAGHADAPAVGPGTAVRIMTGALVPGLAADPADAATEELAIVPVEDTDQPVAPGAPVPEHVEIRAATTPGRHLRRAGEDVRPGDLVVRAGTVLGARDVAAIASVGHGTVLAHPPVRVGVLTTGDELVDPGESLAPGQIPDSNTLLIAGLVRACGAVPVPMRRTSDDPAVLRAAIADAVDPEGVGVDAIVTSGGVSAGAYDVVKEVLAPLGEVRFGKVSMQPGKPQGFGLIDARVPILCLPGNPVSVFVSFQLFVQPVLARLAARFDAPAEPETFEAVAADSWRSPRGREQYVPVVLAGEAGGEVSVRRATAGGSNSHLIGSLGLAQALAIVPAEVDAVHEGDRLRVMMAL